MNKQELINSLKQRLPYNRDEISFMLEIIFSVISENLCDDDDVRTPIGVFKIVTRKEKRVKAFNGKYITVPEQKAIKFIPNKKTVKDINEKK